MERFKGYLLKKGFRQTTVGLYLEVLSDVENTFGLDSFKEPDHVYKAIGQMKKQKKSPRYINMALRCMAHYLDSKGIERNPCKRIRVKGVVRKPGYVLLEEKELEEIYRCYVEHCKGDLLKDRAILGLMLYQGLRGSEVDSLLHSDFDLDKGTVKARGSYRSEGRLLKLEPFQVLPIHLYMERENKEKGGNGKLLFSNGKGSGAAHIMERIYKYCGKKVSARQIRGSVITNWTKRYNLREVQYMAGHRYVTSTEAYQMDIVGSLKEDIMLYHPLDHEG